MEKEFVSYEMALALKELGFDEPCFYQYVKDFDNDGELIPIASETNHPILRNNHQVSHCSRGDCFAAPLYQQAFRFFREKHNLHSNIKCVNTTHNNHFRFEIELNGETLACTNKIESYEKAESKCLQKLIEITKNK